MGYIMSDSFEDNIKLASLIMDSDVSNRMGKDDASRKRVEDLRNLFK